MLVIRFICDYYFRHSYSVQGNFCIWLARISCWIKRKYSCVNEAMENVVQMTVLTILILGNKGTSFIYTDLIGKALLVIAAILTLITGYKYLSASSKHLKN